MTAKESLESLVSGLTEAEAAVLLGRIEADETAKAVRPGDRDAALALLRPMAR